jgi:Fur family transcriptional regulator, zinc uptake regulator
MARPSTLSAPATDLVLKVLRKAKTPLTAYALLEKLKKSGINSAPIIYRALDTLMKKGAVHKIKEMGAFVACDSMHDHHHNLSVLTVCGTCKKVSEVHDHNIINTLENINNLGISLQNHAVIELPITCSHCL